MAGRGRLKAAVYVKDPTTHEDLIVLPGESPPPEIAALVTNPDAWDAQLCDDDEPEPIAVGEPDPAGGTVKPEPESGEAGAGKKAPSRRRRSSSAYCAHRMVWSWALPPAQLRTVPDCEGCSLVDGFQRSWLLAQLGPDTDPADLERSFFRLRSARAVALEVLGERRARLPADPLKVSVDGVVTMDLQENLKGIERQIDQVRQAPAPDELSDENDASEVTTAVTWLAPTRRHR